MSEITVNQTNRGTGAGGANTTANGIGLEMKTRNAYSAMCDSVKILKKTKNLYKVEEVNINGRILNRAPEAAFRSWDKLNGFSKDNKDYTKRGLNGAYFPDDAFIDMNDKIIYWIECKVQKKQGSKCEVLQTYNQKIRNLKERYPGYTINYIYVLVSNFRKKCAKEISYMIEDNITIVWDDDANFEETLKSIIA